MSRNNVILVIRRQNRYYVVADANADTEWSEEWATRHTELDSSRSTKSRAKALVRAHDLQNRIRTEYGVRELSVP